MIFFKTKEQRELEALTKRLVKTIVKSPQLLELVANAKKQWEFDELQQQRLSYPILQDLMNTAQHGVLIDVYLADGSRLVMKQNPNALSQEELERLAEAQRRSDQELF